MRNNYLQQLQKHKNNLFVQKFPHCASLNASQKGKTHVQIIRMIASPCKKIGTSRLPDSVKDKKKKVSRSISITNSLLLSRPKCKIVKEDEILKTNIRQSQVVITPSQDTTLVCRPSANQARNRICSMKTDHQSVSTIDLMNNYSTTFHNLKHNDHNGSKMTVLKQPYSASKKLRNSSAKQHKQRASEAKRDAKSKDSKIDNFKGEQTAKKQQIHFSNADRYTLSDQLSGLLRRAKSVLQLHNEEKAEWAMERQQYKLTIRMLQQKISAKSRNNRRPGKVET